MIRNLEFDPHLRNPFPTSRCSNINNSHSPNLSFLSLCCQDVADTILDRCYRWLPATAAVDCCFLQPRFWVLTCHLLVATTISLMLLTSAADCHHCSTVLAATGCHRYLLEASENCQISLAWQRFTH